MIISFAKLTAAEQLSRLGVRQECPRALEVALQAFRIKINGRKSPQRTTVVAVLRDTSIGVCVEQPNYLAS